MAKTQDPVHLAAGLLGLAFKALLPGVNYTTALEAQRQLHLSIGDSGPGPLADGEAARTALARYGEALGLTPDRTA